jgi:hypothetical protein
MMDESPKVVTRQSRSIARIRTLAKLENGCAKAEQPFEMNTGK